MLALTLSDAKTIALAVVVGLAVASIAAAWLFKSIMQKLLAVVVLGLLGFAVWTQRVSLQDCADKVIDAYELDGINPTLMDTDCSFFGLTITISDPRGPADTGAVDLG